MDSMPVIDPRKYYTIFKGRTDRVTLYNANTCKMISIEVKRGDFEITDRIKAHLGGQSRMAMHNHLADNTCTWANVIFEESTKTPTAKESSLFVRELSKLGLTHAKREKTKIKGENYACWLFFETPISAKKVRYFINLVFKKLDITKAEIMPSEDLLTTGSFGSFAWLPYFGGTDKWIEPNGDIRVDMGAKLGHTIFIDYEGSPLRDPFGKIHKYTEEEIDNAIMFLTEFIPQEPSPEEGTKIQDSHLKKMMDKSLAMREILEEIKQTKNLKEEPLNALGQIFKAFGREDYFHKIMSKIDGYDKDIFDKKLAALPAGLAFPTYSQFKEMGYGKDDPLSLEKRPPYIDRYGKIEEDKSKNQDAWRELTPVVWVFQAIKERLSEEADAETAIIDIDVVDQNEYLESFKADITDRRTKLIEKRRSCSGLDTGFNTLNQVLDGLREDSFTILSSTAGSGKTAFATQIFENIAANEKIACCYVTYGESQKLLTAKMISRNCGIDYRKISRGALTDDEFNKFKQSVKTYKNDIGKLLYIVEGNDSIDARRIKAIIDALPIGLLIIDNLQNIPFASKVQMNDISSRLEHISRQLKTLARYKNIPVLATYTAREKDMNFPELISQEFYMMSSCDNWLSLEEKGVLEPNQGVKEYSLIIKKNKQGDKNILIKMGYQSPYQKFLEVK